MRFLTDGMLGSLARWLRILGEDVLYDKSSGDDELLRRAASEMRILLTADQELYRMAVSKGVDAFLITDKTEPGRLAQMASRFGISLDADTAMSRCPLCGSRIRPVPKADIITRVRPSTYRLYREFWQCTDSTCGKVYWQGSHWKPIKHLLAQARETLEAQSI